MSTRPVHDGTAARSAPVPSRRERARAATIAEIKSTALALMAETGTTDIRFTDIARIMGMTPPALYRYYADRDALLTELITDAYDDLGRALARAREEAGTDDLGALFLAAAQAYRAWARQHPQQFALILGMPVPGYAAPDEGPTTEAAQRAMSQLSSLFTQAAARGKLRRPLVREVAAAVQACALAETKKGEALPPETFQAMLHTWASLHGFASLEAYGHLDWMDEAARDALFRAQVLLSARTAGMPLPR